MKGNKNGYYQLSMRVLQIEYYKLSSSKQMEISEARNRDFEARFWIPKVGYDLGGISEGLHLRENRGKLLLFILLLLLLLLLVFFLLLLSVQSYNLAPCRLAAWRIASTTNWVCEYYKLSTTN